MKKDIPFFEAELIGAMREALAHAQGKLTLRTTVVPVRTSRMSAQRIISIRRKLRASTPVFAAYLNVAPDTVRKWEKSLRRPSGPALRLLQIAERQPQILLAAS
jgi:putative transcriptional regulator